MRAPIALSLALSVALGCGGTSATSRPVNVSDGLAKVAAIHGAAGPWAVAGYRMGRYALAKLGLPAQSFDLEVTHHTPEKVQYSCIADGAEAATGASPGKLNLKLVPASDADVATTYANKATGQSLTLRPTAAFAARFGNLPREKLGDAGREVMALPDEAIFETIRTP